MLARVPPGALMRRAAFGLAVVARRMLAASNGHRVALLVGAGDNGGDAPWAGAELRRRGIGVTAVLLDPRRAHAGGLAALRRAGGRAVDRARRRRGGRSGGPRARRHRRPLRPRAAAPRGRRAGRCRGRRLGAGAGRRLAQRRRPRHRHRRRPGRHGRRDGHLRRAEARARAGRAPVRTRGAGRHRSRSGAAGPARGRPRRGGRGSALAGARPADDKYTQGVTGIAAGSATYPGAAVLASGAAVLATSGMVRYSGSAADLVRARWPEVVATDEFADAARTQSWAVGPGSAPTTPAGRCSQPRWTVTSPCASTPTASRCSAGTPTCGPRSPAGPWCSPRTTGSSPGSPARWDRTASRQPVGRRRRCG